MHSCELLRRSAYAPTYKRVSPAGWRHPIEAWCAAQRTARSARLCSYLYMAYEKGGTWEMSLTR